MELKRIGASSAAKVGGVLYAALGLFADGLIALFTTLGGNMLPAEAAGSAGDIGGVELDP